MRPSTAPGWYLFSIIVVSLLCGVESPPCLAVNRQRAASSRPAQCQRAIPRSPRPPRQIADPLDHPARGRRLRQPGPGAGDRIRSCRRSPPTFTPPSAPPAMVVTAYAIAHGSIQLIIGPVGDRFGKYRTVALTCAIGAVLVAVVRHWTSTLPQLALARLATGAAAGWVIPISMAYVGDVTPSRAAAADPRRATCPARFSASCSARPPAACSATCSAGATYSSCSPGCSRSPPPGWCSSSRSIRRPANASQQRAARRADRAITPRCCRTRSPASSSSPRFFEGALAWGAFAYIGADLHLRFGLSFTLVGSASAASASAG